MYDVSALAEAFDADVRQLDNLLSRNEIEGVERRARGVTRRVSLDGAVTIRVALELARTLRVPFAHALRVAEILATKPDGVEVGQFGVLRFDFAEIRRSTLDQLDSAVETVGRRRRGRPPRAVLGMTG